MACGLNDHVWSLEEIVMMADGYMPKNQRRAALTRNAQFRSLPMIVVVSIVYLISLGAVCVIALELARVRAVVTDRLSSIAEALWRIRDELSEANKRSKISN